MWWVAVLMGATGSLHCVVMCAPLAALAGRRHWLYSFFYHAGKAFTYILLGIILSFLGEIFQIRKIQNLISIIAGVVMIATAFFPHGIEVWHPVLQNALSRLRRAIGKNINSPSPLAPFSFGFLNGLLPCGLLYAALIAAAVQPTATDTALFMLGFAAGTFPAMFSATYFLHIAKDKWSASFQQMKIFLPAGIGLLLIGRGIYTGFLQAGQQHTIPWCP